MFRIGIIGSENSHAKAFAEIFNLDQELYPDMKVTAIGCQDLAASRGIQESCQVDTVVERPEEMLGQVDAVMVTARDGAYHFAYAKPFVEAGLPVFVDKPFTRNPKEAVELVQLAKRLHVPLAGGTSMKYAQELLDLKEAIQKGEIKGGDLAAPVSLENEYGGFFFYASHLVEMTMTLFGGDIRSIQARRVKDTVTAMIEYPDYLVTNHFNEGCYHYSATVYQKDRTLYTELGIDEIYQRECANFAHMLRTGEMDQTYEQLVLPVYYIEAVEKAYETGERQIFPQLPDLEV